VNASDVKTIHFICLISVQELRVSGITFSSIKTTEFTVSWTAPTRSSYVSGYDVEWQSDGKVVDARSPQRITGLTPGKTYVVKVISKDTATQPDDTRTTNTSKQQAASKNFKTLLNVFLYDEDKGENTFAYDYYL
jgi:hypothetical protein